MFPDASDNVDENVETYRWLRTAYKRELNFSSVGEWVTLYGIKRPGWPFRFGFIGDRNTYGAPRSLSYDDDMSRFKTVMRDLWGNSHTIVLEGQAGSCGNFLGGLNDPYTCGAYAPYPYVKDFRFRIAALPEDLAEDAILSGEFYLHLVYLNSPEEQTRLYRFYFHFER